MKKIISYFLLILASIVGFGCGTTETGTSAPAHEEAAATGSSEDETPMIRVGMTKRQVIKAWGDPSAKQVTGHGEIWIWGGQNWKRMIPYAGPFMHVQTSKALFGTDGRVKDFRLTDKGDIMSEGEGYSGGFNSW